MPRATGDPTFLLVHGGATTGRFWDRLVADLDRPALAVDLPGRGDKTADIASLTLDQCAASVLEDVDPVGVGDVAIVAHSSGALVVPRIVAGLSGRVRHVFLSAGSVPPDGGTGLDCMKASHRRRTEAALAWARERGEVITTPGPPEDPEVMREAYGERLDDATLAYVTDPVRSVPDSFNLYYQPVSWESARDVPVTYLKNARDRPVPPELQDEMAARLRGADVVTLDCGHIPAITRPAAFAALLRERTG